MAERGALPSLNQSTNRAAQARSEERQGMALAAQGKIALDGAFRNSVLTESKGFLRDIVSILEYAEEMRAKDARQAYEDRLEAKRKGPVGSKENEEIEEQLDPFGIGMFLAGLTALTGAFLGIRGWEANAIKRIKEIKGLGKSISDGLKSIKQAIYFNLFNTKSIGKVGPFGPELKKPLIVVIGDRIKAIRTAITTALFGALRGGPASLAPMFSPDGKIGSVMKVIGERASQLGTFIKESAKTIFKPFQDIFMGIKNFMTSGAGGTFIKTIGSGARMFLGAVGKIFKPIGILFSFGEGVMEFMKTEGNIFAKLNAGAARFISDFIGAPLDLLFIKLPAKIMGLLGFDNIEAKIKEFSFEEGLFKILKLPGVIIGKLFEAGKKILSGDFAGAAKIIIDPILNLFKAISSAFMNFIKGIPVIGRLFKGENEKIDEDIEKNKKAKEDIAKRQLEIAEIEAENVEKIAELKEKIERSLEGENAFTGFEGPARKQAEYQIKILENQIKTNEALKKNNETKLAELEQENKKLLAKNKMPEGVPNQNASGNGSAADVANLTDSSNQGSGGVVDASNNDNSTNNSSTTISNSQTISGARVHPLYSNYSYG